MKRSRKVKVNYFKLIRSLIILAVIIYFLIIGVHNLIKSLEPKTYEGSYTTYYVSKGETLWTIAKNQNSTENMDIRQIIYLIQKDNNIPSNLQIGQELKLREIYE